ncbi:MAG TPA: AmmeMemoRadiSam system radical SAM enzyme [Elusimicrobiota bacterium]|nr:AmmeMemoRadiSam system radical SAM enzyme [Elusimicrobiota bacterium]
MSLDLTRLTRPGALFEKLDGGNVRCFACGHRCLIADGREGVCRVRFNRGGTLFVPHGYVSALHTDPVEKKPFFHARPGAGAFSFGMVGCDFHCDYCQNWEISQIFRDPAAVGTVRPMPAAELLRAALRSGAQILASTYNEPLITSEWAAELFREAKKRGLLTAYVSNGNATPEVLEYLKPCLDLFKVDLKSFSEDHYRRLGGDLSKVLDSLRRIHEMGFWLEVVTLVVPGFNDADDELKKIAGHLAALSPDIPWHITAFHQDYKRLSSDNTPVETLVRAAKIGRREGLRYVYAGNLPRMVGDYENTYCPDCRELLVERRGFEVRKNRLAADGKCPQCATAIPGRW